MGGIMEQINWPEIVKEAKRRRQDEGLTQKIHASLAGVSIPTIISFDRAETTLSMQKILDILSVVNMVPRIRPKADNLSEFTLTAQSRWTNLISKLPKDSTARHPFGYYACAFEINGPLKTINIREFKKTLEATSSMKFSGWSPFWMPKNKDITPYLIDDTTIECWLGKKYLSREELYSSPDDFWNASILGFMYLQRAYEEDRNTDILRPGTILDLSLPIRNILEIICYADRLRRVISLNPEQTSIRLRMFYTGLKGRKLVNWTNPSKPIFYEDRISKSDEVEIAKILNLLTPDNPEEIAEVVSDMSQELYYQFGTFKLPDEFIIDQVKKTLEGIR
jgi:transcriptional regulator with XRE-family HTH domain